MELDQSFRETFEAYLIGAVILFTLSIGGTFLISLVKQPVDLLVPLKALTLYGLLVILLFDYWVYVYFGKIQREVVLTFAVIVEALIVRSYVPMLAQFFGEVEHYSLGKYPLAFKMLPSISLLFVISGVFVVVYYSVDLEISGRLVRFYGDRTK